MYVAEEYPVFAKVYEISATRDIAKVEVRLAALAGA